MARDVGVSLKVRGTSQNSRWWCVYLAFLSLKVFRSAKPIPEECVRILRIRIVTQSEGLCIILFRLYLLVGSLLPHRWGTFLHILPVEAPLYMQVFFLLILVF